MSGIQTEMGEEHVLFGKIDNVKNLVTLLKAVHIKETATVFAFDKGLKVVVDDTKCAQAIAFIESSIFHDYQIKADCSFVINLNVLMECLNIFGIGSNPGLTTALQMCYSGHGSPLSIILEEGGIITDCQLKTMDPDEVLDFDFDSTDIASKIILKSEALKEIWNDLDTNSDVLEIAFSPDKPNFKLSTCSETGEVKIELSKDSDIVEYFQCSQTQTNRYRMSLMKTTSKALAACVKLSIRTDDRGFINFQYMINIDGGQTCFVEYYVAPNEDLDSD